MSNDPVFREVDEELRRDRMRKLWRQGGPFVIAAAVLVVVGVAGYEGWTWWQKTQSAKSSDQFYAAAELADGTDIAGAQKGLDAVIAQTSGGYPMLAQFREAALLSQNGKTDEAVAAYDALASSLNNTHLRELALILAGNLLIDKGDVDAVQQRVGGSLTPSSPLRNAAREVLGLVQYKAGKLDDAMGNFQAVLDDPLSTRDLRSRIQIYVLQLLAEGAKPITPPADASSAPSSEPSSQASSEASAVGSSEASAASSSEAPSASSSEASAAVDSSTELDVTPPAVVDTSMMSMTAPAALVSSSASAASSEPAVSSASEVSSAAPSSSEAPASSDPVSSSEPLPSSSLSSIASSAPDASSSAP